MLNGKKTYMAAIGIVATAVGAWLAGEATLIEAITTALTGLGLGALRMGVKADAGGGS